jgi:hypothetical protein
VGAISSDLRREVLCGVEVGVVGKVTLHRLDPLAESSEGRILLEHRERGPRDARVHLKETEELEIDGVLCVAAEKSRARHEPFLKEREFAGQAFRGRSGSRVASQREK